MILQLEQEKEGYEIKWYVGDKEYDFTQPLEGELTLTGKYVKVSSYTVKFNSDGGTNVQTQNVLPGETVKEPEEPTKEAFIFEGWYLGNTKYDFTLTVTKSMTLVAKWSEDPNVKRYNVTFDTDGGNTIPKQRIIENKTVSRPSDPTRNGYKFMEWQVDNKKYDFSSKVTKDMTIKALWKEIKTYKVTFDSGVASQTVNEGDKAVKPTNPTKDGFEFIEWQLNGRAYDFNKEVTSDISLTGVWSRIFTVNFDPGDGSSITRKEVLEGGIVTKPTNPTREGYEFVEWQLNGKTYDFNAAVYDHITLTALWKKQYTVTFNSNGGTNVSSQKVVEGNKATKPTNPTRDKYTFKEWQLNGNTYDFNTAVNGNITLTAIWEEVLNYTIRAVKPSGGDVDLSPDRILTVYENNKAISVKEIRFNDGTLLCNGNNTTVGASDISGETTFKVILIDGKEVTATLVS